MSVRESAGTAKHGYQVRAIDRALDILDLFTLRDPELSLTEIATRTRLPKSTALRLLAALETRGFVERSPGRDHFRVGIHAFEVGSIYIQTLTIESEARPFLQSLAQQCNQSANMAVLSRGEIVHIAVLSPDRPIRFYARVGQREKAHATGLGKVLLAELSDAELTEIVREHGLAPATRRTIVSPDVLRMHLAQVRDQGFATDDEESFVGLRCVAAPIRDHESRVVAAVSISGPALEFRDEVLPSYIKAVLDAARDISYRLGYRVRAAMEQEVVATADEELRVASPAV